MKKIAINSSITKYIFVVPSHNLVVVRLGNGPDMFVEGMDKLVSDIIDSLPEA